VLIFDASTCSTNWVRFQTHEKKAIEKFEGKPAAEKAESAKPEKKPAESAAVTT
jgi:hypothetical protein